MVFLCVVEQIDQSNGGKMEVSVLSVMGIQTITSSFFENKKMWYFEFEVDLRKGVLLEDCWFLHGDCTIL